MSFFKDLKEDIAQSVDELTETFAEEEKAGDVADVERPRGVVLEEGLEDLLGLALARIGQRRDHGDLEIVREPCRESVGVALCKVFRDGDEHVVPIVLRLEAKAHREGHKAYRDFEECFHIKRIIFANIEPRCYLCEDCFRPR